MDIQEWLLRCSEAVRRLWPELTADDAADIAIGLWSGHRVLLPEEAAAEWVQHVGFDGGRLEL